jgi:hypothetical protein
VVRAKVPEEEAPEDDQLCDLFVTMVFYPCRGGAFVRFFSGSLGFITNKSFIRNTTMNKHLTILALAGLLSVALSPATVRAQDLVSADFSNPSYTDGALVGQNGWAQFQTQTTDPLTVTSGRVSWAGGATVNNQDAFLAFPEQVTQPASGSTVLNFDLFLNISAPSASNPSYFASLNTTNTSTTSGNFANARLVALAQETGFVFGARVNGQGGYPFAYGTDVLTIGQDYALRAEINMVAGNANDFINLYVGPSFDNLALYATAGYGSGPVSDPSFGAVLVSQFGTVSTAEAGVSIGSVGVSVVPEPSTYAMLALAGTGFAGYVIRRRRR